MGRAMRSSEEVLLSTPELRFGRFRCLPGDARWDHENRIGDWPVLAFPGTPVEIHQQDRPAVVATPLCVMLYDPQQAYRRRLVDRRGDHCVFLGVAPALLEALVGRPDFGRTSVPLAPRDRLGHLLLVEALRHHARDPTCEWRETPAVITEGLYTIVERAVRGSRCGAAAGADARAEPRASTADRHRAIAQAIARHVALRFAEHESVAAIAEAVGVSPAHAARVFRRITGASIHAYRTALRLHAILDRLLEPAVDLSAAALDVGFSSHSHMTAAFREVFGAPPSAWRGRLRRPEKRALAEYLDARLEGAAPAHHGRVAAR